MITLIIWGCNGELTEKCDNLTLKELGNKLVELSKEWILVFDTVRHCSPQIGCTMEITKCARRENYQIGENMDAMMERGVEY